MKFVKPRCVLVYAVAPDGLKASEANSEFNNFVADRSLPLVLFHDHFIESRGGVAVFFVANPEERDALKTNEHLPRWHVEMKPLVFSFSPSAYDEQARYTMEQYRRVDWHELRNKERPRFGRSVIDEANSAEEQL
ncbi:MAG: hypothetical protein AAF385_12195 [Pseudomonadota bacterium]